jgi:hypothetical protein
MKKLRQIPLGVIVDHEHALALIGEPVRNVETARGLGNTALAVGK